MKKRMEKLQTEMRNNKPKQNINVRRVDSENIDADEDQIIIEHKVERWYSINYFKKMMEDDDESGGDIF